MIERVRKQLATWKKKTISLTELEEMLSPLIKTYEELAHLILKLEDEAVLLMVKSKGRTGRTPSLGYQYRIDKSLLVAEYHAELQKFRLCLHPFIHLDDYFSLDPSIWKEDLPYIQQLDTYVRNHALPTTQVPAPERSFELVGDEKWIGEKGGKELLERVRLWALLQIIPVSDPLMFAVNPKTMLATRHFHLIVENKTTYQGLLPALLDTDFSTLIYGCGNKITGSMEQFHAQFPVSGEHLFFYFGDLDKAGITIWHSLAKRQPTLLAYPFYSACLQKASVQGKEYQRDNNEALEQFVAGFDESESKMIRTMLQEGRYYPQEVLKTRELQHIWRGTDWTAWS